MESFRTPKHGNPSFHRCLTKKDVKQVMLRRSKKKIESPKEDLDSKTTTRNQSTVCTKPPKRKSTSFGNLHISTQRRQLSGNETTKAAGKTTEFQSVRGAVNLKNHLGDEPVDLKVKLNGLQQENSRLEKQVSMLGELGISCLGIAKNLDTSELERIKRSIETDVFGEDKIENGLFGLLYRTKSLLSNLS